MSAQPSTLYPAVEKFLRVNGFKKSAKAFRKESDVGSSTEDAEDLVQIYNVYLNSKAATTNGASAEEKEQKKERKKKMKKKKKEKASNGKDAAEKEPKSKKRKREGDDDVSKAEKEPEQQQQNGEEAPQNGSQNGQQNGKKKSITPNRPFQRVRVEEVEIKDPRLLDNSFDANMSADEWGKKAADVLGAVRGKGFRHEKTKKKRGSYRGGSINPNKVNSIKFED
ncbi:Nucleolar and coiled-body phosphoprotein 1 [Balamuthia mandrillaris]